MSTNQEIDGKNHIHDYNEERKNECIAALEAMGLGDYLHLAQERRSIDNCIIRDPHGAAIVCRNGWAFHVAEVMSEMLGRKIEHVKIDATGLGAHIYTTQDNISIPERHSLATMNRYFDDYRPGFHKSESTISLPHALHALAAPVHFLNEADAYELAAALKEVFSNYDVDVADTGEGFSVVVQDESGDLAGFATERIRAVTDVVTAFSLTPKKKSTLVIMDAIDSLDRDWQLATSKRYTQQQRIEDGINAILAHLGHPEASERESIPSAPRNAATGAKGRGIEALIPTKPTPAGKKSSAKRSA